jgi:CRISPR system Cascade subunit CasA
VQASLYRLLLCSLGRVFGPHNATDWVQIRQNKAFDRQSLQDYFERWQSRFDLFDKQRPFFQAGDPRVKPKMLLKMVPHLSSGNNATLFDHSTEAIGVTFTPDEAALYLIALQYYGLGGLSGLRDDKFTGAPPSRGISFFVQGQNLFETLLLNMIRIGDDQLHAIPTSDEERDMPGWEMEDPFQPRQTPYGLFDYLTWHNRRVLFFPEWENRAVVVRKMTEAPGLRMENQFIDGVTIRDPYQYYRQGSQGPLVLRFNEDRAVWRDSASLFRFEGGADLPAPSNLTWLHTLYLMRKLEKKAAYRVNALGMAADKAKVLFYGDESLPLPSEYLEDAARVANLQIALNKAESLSKTLFAAVSGMAEIILSFDSDLKGSKPDAKMVDAMRSHLRGDRVFWSGLENGFYTLVQQIPSEPEKALTNWDDLLRRQAWAALEFSQTLAGDDLRARKAAVKGSAILSSGIHKYLETPREEIVNE